MPPLIEIGIENAVGSMNFVSSRLRDGIISAHPSAESPKPWNHNSTFEYVPERGVRVIPLPFYKIKSSRSKVQEYQMLSVSSVKSRNLTIVGVACYLTIRSSYVHCTAAPESVQEDENELLMLHASATRVAIQNLLRYHKCLAPRRRQ